eukprot:COSAG05_NODE_317_length_11545_cov_73.981391_1_plen_115_part_00
MYWFVFGWTGSVLGLLMILCLKADKPHVEAYNRAKTLIDNGRTDEAVGTVSLFVVLHVVAVELCEMCTSAWHCRCFMRRAKDFFELSSRIVTLCPRPRVCLCVQIWARSGRRQG